MGVPIPEMGEALTRCWAASGSPDLQGSIVGVPVGVPVCTRPRADFGCPHLNRTPFPHPNPISFVGVHFPLSHYNKGTD